MTQWISIGFSFATLLVSVSFFIAYLKARTDQADKDIVNVEKRDDEKLTRLQKTVDRIEIDQKASLDTVALIRNSMTEQAVLNRMLATTVDGLNKKIETNSEICYQHETKLAVLSQKISDLSRDK